MSATIISILTLLMLINLDTMSTPKPVTTNQQTTKELKAIIEQQKPNHYWLYEFNDYEDDDLDII